VTPKFVAMEALGKVVMPARSEDHAFIPANVGGMVRQGKILPHGQSFFEGGRETISSLIADDVNVANHRFSHELEDVIEHGLGSIVLGFRFEQINDKAMHC
jgi:hypothetical protein